MLSKEQLLERAGTYRDMASKAHDAGLRLEFAERADRYETVAVVMKERPASAAARKN